MTVYTDDDVLTDEEVTYLTKMASSSNPVLAAQARAELLKVGPKGYEHGWVFVGVPGVGGRVQHPQHGPGTVTRHGKKTMAARFESGHEAAFEHAPTTPDPDEHFTPRAGAKIPDAVPRGRQELTDRQHESMETVAARLGGDLRTADTKGLNTTSVNTLIRRGYLERVYIPGMRGHVQITDRGNDYLDVRSPNADALHHQKQLLRHRRQMANEYARQVGEEGWDGPSAGAGRRNFLGILDAEKQIIRLREENRAALRARLNPPPPPEPPKEQPAPLPDVTERVDRRMAQIGNKPTSTLHNDLARTLEQTADRDVERARRRLRGGATAPSAFAQEEMQRAYADHERRYADAAEHRRRAAALVADEEEEKRRAAEAWTRLQEGRTSAPAATPQPKQPRKTPPRDRRPADTVAVYDVETGRGMDVPRAEAAAGHLRYARSLGAGSPAAGVGEQRALAVLRGEEGQSTAAALAGGTVPATGRIPLPRRSTAKRGDLIVVQRTSSTSYQGGRPTETKTDVTLGRVTSIDRHGKPTAYQPAGWSSPRKLDGREKHHTVSAKDIDVAAALAAAEANPWSHDPSKTGMPYRSMDEVEQAMQPHLLQALLAGDIKDIPSERLGVIRAATSDQALHARIDRELARRTALGRARPKPPPLPGTRPAKRTKAPAQLAYTEPAGLEPGAPITWRHSYGPGQPTELRTGRVWDRGPDSTAGSPSVWVIPDQPRPDDLYHALLINAPGHGSEPTSSSDPGSYTGGYTQGAARVAQRIRATGKSLTVKRLNKALANDRQLLTKLAALAS